MMALIDWLIGMRTRKRNRGRKSGARRRGPKLTAYSTAVAYLREDVSSLRERLTKHDAQLAELAEKTCDERLEQVVKSALDRLHATSPMVPVQRSVVTGATGSGQPTGGRNQEVQRPTEFQRPLLTPMQAHVLQTMAADGSERYLSYEDIGRLLGKSSGAVKSHINEIKKRGIPLDAVISLNSQARYRLSEQAKKLLGQE